MEKIRISFSYPEKLKAKLERVIEKKGGWRLQGFIKHLLVLRAKQLQKENN